jgi:oligopeptide/dipeptide ABC transporter ATP-binding protein
MRTALAMFPIHPCVAGKMQSDLLTITDFSVSFETEGGIARVLDKVNLRIGTGEIVGLVGESGSGKTTLARAILGVLAPNARVDSGVLTFAGARNEAKVTFVPQDPFSSLSPLFTVGDQIMEMMQWRSPDRRDGERFYARGRRRADRDRALAMLAAVQLPDPGRLLAKYPHEVSGGQRQRIMIAMALLPEPALIVADEPTTALDVTIQAQILKLLRQLATQRDVSVLLTTHDLGTAWEICDRIMVMYAGQEMETAPVTNFFRAPLVPYTRQLLDSLPTANRMPTAIPGEMPGLYVPPAGCRFHPRCQSATNICRVIRPPPVEAEPGHFVRCHHPHVADQAVAAA